MKDSSRNTDLGEDETFAKEAERSRISLLREYWDFIREDRKWWLAPIVFILLLSAAFILLGGTSIAPFIYTLF